MKRSNVLALGVGACLMAGSVSVAQTEAPAPSDTPPPAPGGSGARPGNPAPPLDVWSGTSSEPEVGPAPPPRARFTDDESHSPMADLLTAGFCCISPVLGVGGLAYLTYRMTRKKMGGAPEQ